MIGVASCGMFSRRTALDLLLTRLFAGEALDLGYLAGLGHGGLLAPLGDAPLAVKDFHLTSWRYLAHPPQRFGPRMLRKLAIARGLMVYEGLR